MPWRPQSLSPGGSLSSWRPGAIYASERCWAWSGGMWTSCTAESISCALRMRSAASCRSVRRRPRPVVELSASLPTSCRVSRATSESSWGRGPHLHSSPGLRADDWAGIPSMQLGGLLARDLGAQKSILTISGEPDMGSHSGRYDERTYGTCRTRQSDGGSSLSACSGGSRCCDRGRSVGTGRNGSQPSALDAPAGYSRDEIEDTSTGQSDPPIVARTSDESGRPGSNWHHQLGRLRFYH